MIGPIRAPRSGSLDIARLVEAGGLFRYALRHDRAPVEWVRTLSHVAVGAILGWGALAWFVVGTGPKP